MSKLLKCPVCGFKKWVRKDAEVCSSNCRQRKLRKKLKELNELKSKEV